VYNIPYLTSNYTDILKDPEVKGIVITTTTNTHKDLIIQAADHGKHVFCEKPAG
jgi:myo-inositol 2-dehydrogenase/D-chiro-inositol 1-dehydrogenase